MNEEEIYDLIAYLKIIYENQFKGETEPIIMAWQDILIDIEKKYIMKAAREYVKNDISGFAPIPAKLRLVAKEYKSNDLVNENILRLQEPEKRDPPPPEEQRRNEELYLDCKRILRGE